MKGMFLGKAMRTLALVIALALALVSAPAIASAPKYTTRIEPDKDELFIIAGKQAQVKVTVFVKGGRADYLGYELTDPEVVKCTRSKITQKAVVFTLKGLKEGTSQLILTSEQTDGPKVEPVAVDIVVYPKKAKPTAIALNHTEVTIRRGEKIDLSAEVEPYHPKQVVTWKSQKPKIAGVSAKGRVTGKKVGTATVVARAKGSNLLALCIVNVLPKDAPEATDPPQENPGEGGADEGGTPTE